MVREVAILGAAMVAFQVSCPHAQGAPVTEADVHHAHHKAKASVHTATVAPPHKARVVSLQVATVHKKVVRRPVAHTTAEPEPLEAAVQVPTPEVDVANGAPTPLAFHVGPAIVAPGDQSDEAPNQGPALPNTPPVLTQQESEAGQLANAQGDRTFVMVDKARGKIILFESGQAVYAGPALTGLSTADRIPKNEMTEKFDNLNAPNTKITPAGRYTVERGFDPEVGGPLFDIHEIRGKDWGIAIHQLYLGIPAEHRDVRILSPRDEDKHITYGCINITTASMRVLMRELPAKGPIALYILPEDASQTAAYLASGTSS